MKTTNKKLSQNKLHGCGNTFFIVDEQKDGFAIDRVRYVIEKAKEEQVNGVLFLSRLKSGADLEMKVFDRDGTEESMCGNGLRCLAKYAYDAGYIGSRANILTGDGIKKVTINGSSVTADMGTPRQFKRLGESCYFIFTGVPHILCFVDDLCIDEAYNKGRKIRHDKQLCTMLGHANGASVNFVKVHARNEIGITTYEIGVEAVTKTCGTGSAGAAYVAHIVKNCKFPIKVRNTGGEVIIEFRNSNLVMTGHAEYI